MKGSFAFIHCFYTKERPESHMIQALIWVQREMWRPGSQHTSSLVSSPHVVMLVINSKDLHIISGIKICIVSVYC